MSMDSLFDHRQREASCRFRKEFDARTDDDKQKIITAFRDTSIPTTWIYQVLKDNGFTSSETTVRSHRRGRCNSCGNLWIV